MKYLEALVEILRGLTGPQLAVLLVIGLVLLLAGVAIGWGLFHVPRPRGLYIAPHRHF